MAIQASIPDLEKTPPIINDIVEISRSRAYSVAYECINSSCRSIRAVEFVVQCHIRGPLIENMSQRMLPLFVSSQLVSPIESQRN